MWFYKISHDNKIDIGLMNSQKIGSDIFEWLPFCFFPLHLSSLQIFILYELPYLRPNNYSFFDFSATYPEKFNFKIHKSSALWSIVMTNFLWVQVRRTEEVNKLFHRCIMESLLHPTVLDNRFTSRSLSLDVIFSDPTNLPTQKATKFCVANLQAREQWLLNPHKSYNYIFRVGSFPNVVSYYHTTLNS